MGNVMEMNAKMNWKVNLSQIQDGCVVIQKVTLNTLEIHWQNVEVALTIKKKQGLNKTLKRSGSMVDTESRMLFPSQERSLQQWYQMWQLKGWNIAKMDKWCIGLRKGQKNLMLLWYTIVFVLLKDDMVK